jgi:hypothetical protein
LPIIIICTHEDNYCSDKFNRMLAKLPQPKEVIMAKEDMETTKNKIIGALGGVDKTEIGIDEMGLTD